MRGQRQKGDGKISIKLLKFDVDLVSSAEMGDLPPWELQTKANICSSILIISQKNIDFGRLKKNETRSRTLVLHNGSETALFYKILTTRSISSRNMSINDGQMGVVYPYKSREIPFVFKSGMTGQFVERLTVLNILDPDNSQVISLKATILAPPTFDFEPASFAVDMKLNDVAVLPIIVLSNTSLQAREFVIKFESYQLPGGLRLIVEFEPNGPDCIILSKEIVAKIEGLKQKLKIAINKKNDVKRKTILQKIKKLEAGDEDAKGDVDVEETYFAGDQEQPRLAHVVQKTLMSICVQGGRRQAIKILLRVEFFSPLGRFTWNLSRKCNIICHERSNTDIIKCTEMTLNILLSPNRATSDVIPQNSEPFPPIFALPPVMPSTFALHPASFDFGLSNIRDKHVGSFFIENLTPESLHFSLTDIKKTFQQEWTTHGDLKTTHLAPQDTGKFLCDPCIGWVKPWTRQIVIFSLEPMLPGRQQYEVVVKNIANKQTQSFRCDIMARSPELFRFPDFNSVSDVLLAFGSCYVQDGVRFVKVLPLRIRSVHRQHLSLTCTSNLLNQVLIFVDSALNTPCTTIKLLAYNSITIYIALKPALNEDAMNAGECKEMEGGIQLRATEWSSPSHTIRHAAPAFTNVTVRFTALIGKCILKISKKVLKLGKLSKIGSVISGTLVLANLSTRFSLEYSITVPSSVMLSNCSGSLPAKSSQSIDVQCIATVFGLSTFELEIKNLKNPKSKNLVLLLLFVDEGIVRCLPYSDSNENLIFSRVYLQSSDLQIASTDDLKPISDSSNKWTVVKKIVDLQNDTNESPTLSLKGPGPVTLSNNSDTVLFLRPISDVGVSVIWKHGVDVLGRPCPRFV